MEYVTSPEGPTVDEVLRLIDIERQKMHVIGSIDYENDALNIIRDDLISAKITPREAIKRLHDIVERRQEYR